MDPWERKGVQSVPKTRDENAEDDDVLLLTPWHVARLLSLIHVQHEDWDSYRLVGAVQLLKAFSLVTVDSLVGHVSVSMHPLIHAWARDRQDNRQRHKNWVQMGCVMAVGGEDGVAWGRHQRQLQPHFEALVEWEVDVTFAEEPAVMVAPTLVNVGYILYRLRSDGVLFALLAKIFTPLHLDRLDVDSHWLGVYNLAGRNLVNCGKARDVVPVMEEVMTIEEQTLAGDHPD